MSLWADVPSDIGVMVAKALDRLSERIPDLPDDQRPWWVTDEDLADQRRADALYVMAVAGLAGDTDMERSTIVIHADAERLAKGTGGFYEESGGIIHADTLARLACCSRIQWLVTRADGKLLVETTRSPSPPLWRAVKNRDGHRCCAPGCGRKGNLVPHHIAHSAFDGPTRLDNLICVCTFHHRLLHEGGWRVSLLKDGTTAWFKPSGERYEPGPAPPGDPPSVAA
jgi:hypothetical protein